MGKMQEVIGAGHNNLLGFAKKRSMAEGNQRRTGIMRFGILQKLILGFLLPVVFMIILGVISYRKASEGLITNYEQATQNTFQMASSYMQFVMESMDVVAQQYTNDNNINYFTRGLVYTDSQERLSYVTKINNELLTKSNLEKFIENIHIIPKESVPVLTSDMENMTGFFSELIGEPEGKLMADNKIVSYWTGGHPYIDSKFGIKSNTYAMSLFRTFPSGEACIIVDINGDEVEKFLTELELGDNSIVALITEDGREIIINHTEVGLEDKGKPISFLDQNYYQESIQSDDMVGSKYVEYNSEEHLFMYSRLGDTGITICGLTPKSSFMKQANEIRVTTLLLVLFASVVAVTIGFIISNGIGLAMKKINRKLQQISAGDLTVQVSVKRKDEFADLAVNVMDMLNNMRMLIQKVTNVSGLVSESAANVMEASRTIAESNDNITQAVDEIGKGIESQAEESQNCLTQMDELSGKITVVNTNVEEIEKAMDEMKSMISDGINTMEDLTKQSDATNQITKYVVTNISTLESKTKSIENIVQVINDIADQTNLLSLNASIEAARAGEAGKGFAVVASEIRTLANKSMESAGEIQYVIGEIMSQTNGTVKTAKEAEDIVQLQNEIVNKTIEAFHNMNSGIEQLITKLSTIGYNMKNMGTARESTLGAVENISAISEETLAASGSIEKTVYDQSTSVATLEEAAEKMGTNANELKKAITIFKI